MSTVEYCPVDGCWLRVGHRSGHGRTGSPGGPLVCVCHTPRPARNDECLRCRRVIAELVHARRRDGRMRHPVTGRYMAGDCERDCLEHCAGLCGVP